MTSSIAYDRLDPSVTYEPSASDPMTGRARVNGRVYWFVVNELDRDGLPVSVSLTPIDGPLRRFIQKLF